MKRDIKVSNLKGLLIFLVVFGHLLELFADRYEGLFLLLYSFHMPLFVLISGYLAKRADGRKTVNFLLLYILYQPVYRIFLTVLNAGEPLAFHYDRPYYHLWYLVSMAFWYLMAIGIKRLTLKREGKIALVIGFCMIGIVSRYFTGQISAFLQHIYTDFSSYTLSYQRTLTFLPFFFIGYFMPERGMQKIQKSLKWKWGISALAVLLISLYFALPAKDNTAKLLKSNTEMILKGSYGMDSMQGQSAAVMGQIVIWFLAAWLMCYLLLNLISKREMQLTKIGDRSMPVYLFHVFFTMLIDKITFLDQLNPVLLLVLMFGTAVGIVLLLSSDIVMKFSNYFCYPYKLSIRITQKLIAAIR